MKMKSWITIFWAGVILCLFLSEIMVIYGIPTCHETTDGYLLITQPVYNVALNFATFGGMWFGLFFTLFVCSEDAKKFFRVEG